jgi:hypothetical protein
MWFLGFDIEVFDFFQKNLHHNIGVLDEDTPLLKQV